MQSKLAGQQVSTKHVKVKVKVVININLTGHADFNAQSTINNTWSSTSHDDFNAQSRSNPKSNLPA